MSVASSSFSEMARLFRATRISRRLMFAELLEQGLAEIERRVLP